MQHLSPKRCGTNEKDLAELKDEKRGELEAGKTPEVILNEVFQKLGDEYRAVPRFSGVEMFVWLVPIAYVAFGLMIAVGVSIRRKRSQLFLSYTAR